MKINKKIVQQVFSEEFGVKKERVDEVDSFRERCYRAEMGRLRFDAYYVDFDARSFVEVYLDAEIITTYEVVKEQGKVKIMQV